MTALSFLAHARKFRPLSKLFGLALVGTLLAAACTSDINYVPGDSGDGDGDDDDDSSAGGGRSSGDGDGDGDGGMGGEGNQGEACDNNKKDPGETDVDCGGKDCDPCRVGEICKIDIDCKNESCVGKTCQDPSCTDDEKNGDGERPETDIDCGGGDCAGCGDGKICELDSDCRSNHCEGSRCVEATCDDNRPNGDESDLDCGGSCEDKCLPGKMCSDRDDCLLPPEDDPSSTVCLGGLCKLSCAAGQDDCDQDVENGCETNLGSDAAHCGACNNFCDLANVRSNKCDGGSCAIDFEANGCSEDFLDLNGDPGDGCEVNTNSDPLNCGGKDIVCSSTNGEASCYGGSCTILCAEGFEDCDDDAGSNGCEADINSSILTCGTCINSCAAPPVGETSFCDTSMATACQSKVCDPLECDANGIGPCGDCDSSGVCGDLLTTIENCGGCGIICDATNAIAACVDQGAGALGCAIGECVDVDGAVFEDCDGDYMNGCEIDVVTSIEHCGGCNTAGGSNCSSFIGSNDITAVDCGVSACKVTSCAVGTDDCNDNFNDGCETNKNTSLSHCGTCGNACVEKPNSSVVCNAGAACLWSCDDGFIDADLDLDTGSNGCEALEVVYVAPASGTVTRASAASSGGTLSLSHDLQTAPGNSRLVVIAIATQQNVGDNFGQDSVVYGGHSASWVEAAPPSDTDGALSSSSLWLIYDDNLGAAGSKSLVITPPDDWGNTYVEVHEFRGVKQYPAPIDVPSINLKDPTNCAGAIVTEALTTSARSRLFGFTTSQVDPNRTKAHPADYSEAEGMLSAPLLSDLAISNSPQPALMVASALSGILTAGSNTGGFLQFDCWETSLSLIELEAGTAAP